MNENIITIATKKLITAELDDTIHKVLDVIDSHNLSCLPVVDSDGKCFGVITATDLVHFMSKKLNPDAELAWEVCTHKVLEVSPKTPIKEVAQLMIDNNIHHVVISENSTIIGIVSSLDLVHEYVIDHPKEKF
mgnify:CR=1 FL=1